MRDNFHVLELKLLNEEIMTEALLLCSLLAATSQLSVLIGEKDEMRNRICVVTQTLMSGFTVHSQYCHGSVVRRLHGAIHWIVI